jgi:predicted dehydrogenase
MKKHLVIAGFDDIIADKYMDTIYQAISDGHISGYSIIDLFSTQKWIEKKLQQVKIQPELKYYIKVLKHKNKWADIKDFKPIFNEIINKKGEIMVYIATELKAHEEYLQYCIENNIDSLTEKPIFSPMKDGKFEPLLIDKKMKHFLSLAQESSAKHSITSLARYHAIYNDEVINKVKERVLKYNAPLTSLHLRFAAGVWNTHVEYESREDHPYKYGYGMLMHGAYHYIDIITQFLLLNYLIFPNDTLQLTLSSYGSFPVDQNDRISKKYSALFSDNKQNWADVNKVNYGETDIVTSFHLFNVTTNKVITLGTISLEQTTPSIRTWKDIPVEIYNKNGRIAAADLEAQLSTLFTLNLKCYDVPTKGEIDHIKAFARIETRANAPLLPDEKFYTKTEFNDVSHNISNRELIGNWLAGVEKKSTLQSHLIVMKILQSLAESIRKPGYPVSFNFTEYAMKSNTKA